MSTSPQRLLQEYHQQAQDYALSDMLHARRGVLDADVDIELDEPHRAGLKIVVIRRGRLRCESGTGTLVELNGPSLLLAAGQDDFVLNNLFQAGEPLDYTLLQFSTAWLEQNDVRLPPGLDGRRHAQLVPLVAPAELIGQARQLFACPLHESLRGLWFSAKANELAAHCLHQCLNRSAAASSVDVRLAARDVARLQLAREILLAEMEQPPSLDRLAQRAGLNTRKLTQGFRQLFGTSVFGLLQEHRLQTAWRLLSEQDLHVSTVAWQVGYTPAHFSVAFRKRFGVMPCDVKKR
ncbi:helix-turn-helix transcriptional regulator [Serratia marcescens]|uniref:helix-turn-helix transcriptional regulator n=1 Tax=Serratia marcescens TaxID=615 RepID=UPI0035BBF778